MEEVKIKDIQLAKNQLKSMYSHLFLPNIDKDYYRKDIKMYEMFDFILNELEKNIQDKRK